MAESTIAVLHPGTMGTAVATLLRRKDMDVLWLPEGCSSREQREHMAAGVRGEPIAPPTDDVGRFLAALALLSEEDPELDAVQSRFFNMLMTPRALLGDPVALPRVRDHLRTHPDVAAPARGPDRPEFERLVTSRPGHTVTHEEERP